MWSSSSATSEVLIAIPSSVACFQLQPGHPSTSLWLRRLPVRRRLHIRWNLNPRATEETKATKRPQYPEAMKRLPQIRDWLSRASFTPPGPSFMNQRGPDRDANYDDYVGQNQVPEMDSDDWTDDETKTLISPPSIFGTLSDFYVDKDIVQRNKLRETDNEDWADETSTLVPPTVDYGALSDFCENDKIARNKKASEMDGGDWADETCTLTSPTADYGAPSDFCVGDEIDQNKNGLEMNSGDWTNETSTLASPTQTFEAPYDFYVDYDGMRNMKEVLRTRRDDSDWPDETSTVSSVTPSELFGPSPSENLNDDNSRLDSPGPRLPRFLSDFCRDYWACLGELRESGQVIFYEDENN